MGSSSSQQLFRCSSLSNLVKRPRKGELLAKGTRDYLDTVYIENTFGRKKEFTSQYTEKGILVEEVSITMVSDYFGTILVKNKEWLKNDFICGTPDIRHVFDKEKVVVDIKSSWDIWTFFRAGMRVEYYWQLLGYMWLTGCRRAMLVYCLVNTPEHLIVAEKQKQMWRTGFEEGTKEYDDMETSIEKNATFDDIPIEKRVKVIDLIIPEDVFAEKIAHLKQQILYSRKYLSSLKW